MTTSEEQLLTIARYARDHASTPVALTVGQMCAALGVSRSAFYRAFTSREHVLQAMAQAGIETGEHRTAEDRAIQAAAAIIRRQGIQSLTLEAVATEAGIALPTVYAIFQNRAGLMRAVFERYSPLPMVSATLPAAPPGDAATFQAIVTAALQRIWDFLDAESGLLIAMVSELVRQPDGDVHAWLRDFYVPQVVALLAPFMGAAMDSGLIRRGAPIVTAQAAVGPLFFHFFTRSLLTEVGVDLPPRNDVCAKLAETFCRGVIMQEYTP